MENFPDSFQKSSSHRFQMHCCDTDAVAKRSPKGLRYFAHKGKRPSSCEWKPESDLHIMLKEAAVETVKKRTGWCGTIERTESNKWKADAFAERGKIKIAIEIQTSAQSRSTTNERNLRYWNDSVIPFWLKGPRNANNDFGDGFQQLLSGQDVKEMIDSAQRAVDIFLQKIENQVALTNAVIKTLHNYRNWKTKLFYEANLPIYIAVTNGVKNQNIILCELGDELLPLALKPHQIDTTKEFSGATIKLFVDGTDIRGYGSFGFRIDKRNFQSSVKKAISPILKGQKVWRGRSHQEPVPGSFVFYKETCTNCYQDFLRIPNIIIGNPRYPTVHPPKLEGQDYATMSGLTEAAERLAGREGIPLGVFNGNSGNHLYDPSPTRQLCPNCHCFAPASLLTDEEAFSWPYIEEYFHLPIPLGGPGWTSPLVWRYRPIGEAADWERMMSLKFTERKQRCEEREKKRERERREREAANIESKRLAEEKTKQRKAEEQEEREKRERKLEAERVQREEVAAANRRGRLSEKASKVFTNPDEHNLWLNSSNPNTQRMKPVEFATLGEKQLDQAIAALPRKR